MKRREDGVVIEAGWLRKKRKMDLERREDGLGRKAGWIRKSIGRRSWTGVSRT